MSLLMIGFIAMETFAVTAGVHFSEKQVEFFPLRQTDGEA